jgi:plasmid stabilization system protein ParE
VQVEWTQGARISLARIRDFNLERSEQWAARVETRLRERAESLAQTAFSGRRIAFGIRALSVPDIQYVLQYRVDADRVLILRVVSTREIR